MIRIALSAHADDILLAQRVRKYLSDVAWDSVASYDANGSREAYLSAMGLQKCVIVLWTQVSKYSRWIEEDIALAHKRSALLMVSDGEPLPDMLKGVPLVTLVSRSHDGPLKFDKSFLEATAAVLRTGTLEDEALRNRRLMNTALTVQSMIDQRQFLSEELFAGLAGVQQNLAARRQGGRLPGPIVALLSSSRREPLRGKVRISAFVGELRRLSHALVPPRFLGRVSDIGGNDSDRLDCSVFSPPKAPPTARLLVQVFLHTLEHAKEVVELSMTIDDASRLRGRTTLDTKVKRGAHIGIVLESNGLAIEDNVGSLIWQGEATSINFICDIPEKNMQSTIIPVVWLTIDGQIVGRIAFKIEIDRKAFVSSSLYQVGTARKFNSVFFSYSSEDREVVLRCAQAYKAVGVEFFQDILSLAPGARWNDALIKEIDKCDLFLLFWSENARRSPWVQLEAMYALLVSHKRGGNGLDIVPFVLDGPPAPTPPSYLAHLHFDDWVQWVASVLKRSNS